MACDCLLLASTEEIDLDAHIMLVKFYSKTGKMWSGTMMNQLWWFAGLSLIALFVDYGKAELAQKCWEAAVEVLYC